MYEAFYGLQDRPFLTVPDPQFLYWSKSHEMAYTMLNYGLISRAPITVITGEIGAGKTTLIRRLLSEMPDDTVVGLISNAQVGRGELLQWIMMQLDAELRENESYVSLFRRFQDLLVETYAANKRVVLICDEAQNLSVDQLEEMRMLSNVNADKDQLLQLILVGQPQLRDMINSPDLRQFSQRISSDFHLEALDAASIDEYIQYRLSMVGASWRIFSADAAEVVYQATGGVPRLINVLCDLCLVYGYAAQQKVVDAAIIRQFLSSARQRNIYNQFTQPRDGASSVQEAMS